MNCAPPAPINPPGYRALFIPTAAIGLAMVVVVMPVRELRSPGAHQPGVCGSSISPYLAGYLMQQVALELSLELAALLQALNAMLYYLFFRAVRPPEEISADTGERP